jgi:hypothetical protein
LEILPVRHVVQTTSAAVCGEAPKVQKSRSKERILTSYHAERKATN